MLNIATDLKDKRWLAYLLEEFKRINRAEFDIDVVDLKHSKEGPVLYYSQTFTGSPLVINRSDVVPDGKTVNVAEDIFICAGTYTDDRRFSVPYDLFWNAFIFLSRYEEYLSERSGRKVESYSFKHPRADKRTFRIPVVNELFDVLEALIKRHFSGLTFGGKQKPVMELSHDVDYIRKTWPLRIKQTAFNFYNALRAVSRLVRFKENMHSTMRFLLSNPSYWCFDYWEGLEKSMEKRSIFYVYAKTGTRRWRSILIDPSYDVRRDRRLQDKLKDLSAEGFQIGLHGSFASATDEELLKAEKEILEQSLDLKITRTRQHWLRYEERITPHIHNKLFDADSTIGFNDRIGFRAGCASRFRPYDHEHQVAFDFYEVPLIIMDSNLYDYGNADTPFWVAEAIDMVKRLNTYKSSHVSISWHQRVCNDDYRWHGAYERLMETARSLDF